MAHRGGAGVPGLEGLENTLRAFRNATDLGFVYLETDVHASADGVLIAIHDAILDRVCDRPGAVADLTAAEIASARIGGAEPVPLMAELLEEFPAARFNIDIKAPGAVGPLADLLAATGSEGRVCVGSFSRARLAEFRRRTGGRVATSAPTSEAAPFVVLPSGRLAHAIGAGRASVLQLPHRRHGLPVVTRGLVARAHRAGVPVHVWTVDDPAEMTELIDLGVDGLITDRPDLLRAVLEDRGLWHRGGAGPGPEQGGDRG